MTFLIRIRSLVFFAIIVSFFAYNNINVVVRRRINAKVMELNGKTHSEAVTEVRDIEVSRYLVVGLIIVISHS